MKNIKRFSVIMVVHNGKKLINKALKSLIINLESNDELILIDNKSTDGTLNFVKKILKNKINYTIVKLVKNLGVTKGRNIGLKKANAKFITFLDYDDYFPKNRLNNHLKIFYKYKKVDVVKGYVKFIFTNKKLEKLYKKNYLYNQNKTFTIINKNPVNLGALSFRKKIFYKQKFNNKLKYGEDTDLSIKLTMLNYKFYNNKKISLFYRIHGNNMTLNRKYPVNLKNHFHSQRIEDRKAILKSIFTNFRKKIN
jgi:glycosyltransferase involved in cell wall biosynthesis